MCRVQEAPLTKGLHPHLPPAALFLSLFPTFRPPKLSSAEPELLETQSTALPPQHIAFPRHTPPTWVWPLKSFTGSSGFPLLKAKVQSA